jgi:hypothetical protein
MTKQDLSLIAQIIEAATKAGLFQAADLTVIGTLYQRVADELKKEVE